MLVEFKVGNFLSYKHITTFSLVAYTPIKQHIGEGGDTCNLINTAHKDLKLLKSAVVYGANNSGKSNLFSAFSFFKKFILDSSKEHNASDEIPLIPFLLNTETAEAPSYFEITFYTNKIRYRYGFEADTTKIHSEWLFALNSEISSTESKLFTREFQNISVISKYFKEGKGLDDKTRPNALFLSVVEQFNGQIAIEILSFLKENLNIISGLEDTTMFYTINKFLNDASFKNTIIEFFKNINIGFDDIQISEEGDLLGKLKQIPTGLSKEMKEVFDALKKLEKKIKNGPLSEQKAVSINTLHKKFDQAGNFLELVSLDFNLESKGTKKIFSLLGPIVDTIEQGKILIIDELDSRLHTLLTMALVKMFHNKKNEKAQLIFASHDTNLLRNDLFRRDQIWFTEKDEEGTTDLYSLIEFKINQATVRNDASFDKDYLAGKYGAIPFLSNIERFENEFLYEDTNQS